MNKNYMTPKSEIVKIEMPITLLAGSVIESEDYGLGFGGVDDEGKVELD